MLFAASMTVSNIYCTNAYVGLCSIDGNYKMKPTLIKVSQHIFEG